MKALKIVGMIICYLLINASSCEKNPNCYGKWDERLRFSNNSPYNVYVIHSTGYPDTIPLNIFDHSHYRRNYHITNSKIVKRELCDWNSYYERNNQDIVMFFVFKDTVNTGNVNILEDLEKSTMVVVENYPFLKRYDLSLQDLEDMDWVIEFSH